MTTTDTLVFDLDGTLIHSAPDICDAVNRALVEHGRPSLDLPHIISFIGNGVEVLVERSLGATGGMTTPLHAAVLHSFRLAYAERPVSLTQPYAGVIDCLEAARAAGHRLGICTNKPEDAAHDICRRLGLEDFFPVIVGAREGAPRKPDPAPLLDCIRRLGSTGGSTLYVGDSAVDYRTARNAGVRFKLFSGGYLNQPLPELAAGDRFDTWCATSLGL